MVFSSLRSKFIPQVNFSQLFLRAIRAGNRDIALLLVTHVPDINVKNESGETALMLAAILVSSFCLEFL